MTKFEFGAEDMPTVLAVTDLGEHNHGKISAAGLQGERREAFVGDIAKPEYHKLATNRFVCVDMRLPEGGRDLPEGYADPQIAGGPAVNETAVDMMVVGDQTQPQSELIAKNTREVRDTGYRVAVHGDSHKKKAGCGANGNDRETLRSNAQNIDVVAPKAWYLSQELGLEAYITQDDVVRLITNGAHNAEKDELFDVTPEEKVDIIVKNGGEYEELQFDHEEHAIAVEVGDKVFDQEGFMHDHISENGTELGAFAAALGAYKKLEFEKTARLGGDERDAALRMVATILFNLGLPKELIAEETGAGETLPVVVLK
jgi:uncharacterized Zn-binding protein involved in type VI secretion